MTDVDILQIQSDQLHINLNMGNAATTLNEAGKPLNIFNFTVENLKNEPVDLETLRGKKAYVLVNTASSWGLADKNLKELQVLYAKYK